MPILNMIYGATGGGGGGWQPGANTLLYIPMDTASGTTDQSQYHRTYTVSGLTHTTLSGVDCYQTNGGYIDLGTSAVSWLVPAAHTFTAHFWVNTSGHTSTQNVFQGAVNGSYFLGINVRNTDKIMLVGGTPGGGDEWTFLSDSAISRNNWHLLSFSVGSGIDKLYVDGVLQSNTKSGGPNYGFGAWHTTSDNGIYIFADRGGDDRFIGYVGQVVMEDIERTTQEISDYYDQTKGDYGIS